VAETRRSYRAARIMCFREMEAEMEGGSVGIAEIQIVLYKKGDQFPAVRSKVINK